MPILVQTQCWSKINTLVVASSSVYTGLLCIKSMGHRILDQIFHILAFKVSGNSTQPSLHNISYFRVGYTEWGLRCKIGDPETMFLGPKRLSVLSVQMYCWVIHQSVKVNEMILLSHYWSGGIKGQLHNTGIPKCVPVLVFWTFKRNILQAHVVHDK